MSEDGGGGGGRQRDRERKRKNKGNKEKTGLIMPGNRCQCARPKMVQKLSGKVNETLWAKPQASEKAQRQCLKTRAEMRSCQPLSDILLSFQDPALGVCLCVVFFLVGGLFWKD